MNENKELIVRAATSPETLKDWQAEEILRLADTPVGAALIASSAHLQVILEKVSGLRERLLKEKYYFQRSREIIAGRKDIDLSPAEMIILAADGYVSIPLALLRRKTLPDEVWRVLMLNDFSHVRESGQKHPRAPEWVKIST